MVVVSTHSPEHLMWIRVFCGPELAISAVALYDGPEPAERRRSRAGVMLLLESEHEDAPGMSESVNMLCNVYY